MKSINTHLVGILGVVSALIGVLGSPEVQASLLHAAPTSWGGPLSTAFVIFGTAAAYFGRPLTIAKGPPL